MSTFRGNLEPGRECGRSRFGALPVGKGIPGRQSYHGEQDEIKMNPITKNLFTTKKGEKEGVENTEAETEHQPSTSNSTPGTPLAAKEGGSRIPLRTSGSDARMEPRVLVKKIEEVKITPRILRGSGSKKGVAKSTPSTSRGSQGTLATYQASLAACEKEEAILDSNKRFRR